MALASYNSHVSLHFNLRLCPLFLFPEKVKFLEVFILRRIPSPIIGRPLNGIISSNLRQVLCLALAIILHFIVDPNV